MALNKAQLEADLLALQNLAKTTELTEAQYAAAQATAIDNYTKTGTVSIPAGQPVATPDTLVGTNTSIWTGTYS